MIISGTRSGMLPVSSPEISQKISQKISLETNLRVSPETRSENSSWDSFSGYLGNFFQDCNGSSCMYSFMVFFQDFCWNSHQKYYQNYS